MKLLVLPFPTGAFFHSNLAFLQKILTHHISFCKWWPPWLRGFVCAYHPAAPGLDPKHTIYAFFNLYWNCNEKRTKINKKRPGLAHFFKKSCYDYYVVVYHCIGVIYLVIATNMMQIRCFFWLRLLQPLWNKLSTHFNNEPWVVTCRKVIAKIP